MGDKRRGGKRRGDEEPQKLSKEDDAIARFVRFNCPTKTTMFEGNEVHYFSGSKAVDVLFESKQYGHEAKEVKFSTRSSAVAMMRSLLEKGLLFRARKLVAKRKDDKRDKDKGDVEKSPKRKPKKEEQTEKEAKERKEKKKEKAKDSDANDEDEEKEKEKKKDKDDEKKKRKVKLELHQDQSFNDSNDVYVWIFDPTPLVKKIIGALMVLGTIVGCLFPLWPMWLRQGVYYMSLVALACFGVLIGVAIARTILFALIWACTMGRHKLWLLPNLTEDCGFFESFKPWYTYEYVSDTTTTSTKKKKKTDSKKTDDNSDKSDSKEKSGEEGEHKSEEESSNEKDKVHLRDKKQRAPEESVDSEEGSASEQEDEQSSQGSGVSEDIESNNRSEEDKKPRERRRAHKDNDDFVLVEKQ